MKSIIVSVTILTIFVIDLIGFAGAVECIPNLVTCPDPPLLNGFGPGPVCNPADCTPPNPPVYCVSGLISCSGFPKNKFLGVGPRCNPADCIPAPAKCNPRLPACPDPPIKYGIGPVCNPANCIHDSDEPTPPKCIKGLFTCPKHWNPRAGRGPVCNPANCTEY